MALAGFVTWNPTGESETILNDALYVFQEYEDYLPLTGRQVFYRLVGAHGYPKDDKFANKLYGVLGRARRAGMLPFTHLRDGGGSQQVPLTYADEEAFWTKVDNDLLHFSRQRQRGQEVYVELFCEAPGMMPQLVRAAFPYSVPVYGTRGYTGLSVVGEVARRALQRDLPTTILQVGDLDPSGVGIFDTLAADVEAFVRQAVGVAVRKGNTILGERLGVSKERMDAIVSGEAGSGRHSMLPAVACERIALTWDQVDEYELPTAPPSSKDSRSKNWPYDETAQAEALPPDILQKIVRESIEAQFDMAVYYAECDLEAADREAIQERLDR